MRRQPQICPKKAAIPIKALGKPPEEAGCGRGKTEGDSFPKRHGNHIGLGKIRGNGVGRQAVETCCFMHARKRRREKKMTPKEGETREV